MLMQMHAMAMRKMVLEALNGMSWHAVYPRDGPDKPSRQMVERAATP